MNPAAYLRRAWRWFVRKTLGIWVRASIKPDDAPASIAARTRPVCYVLERESEADLAVLSNVCAQQGLPPPDNACFAILHPARLFGRRNPARAPRILVQMIASTAAQPHFDVDLVPVTIFWGRAPGKQTGLWHLLFADDWVLVGRFRKFLTMLISGRNTLVHFGEPLALHDALQHGLSEPLSVRRVLRHLRGVLRAQRTSTIGPDLSHRRTMVAQLLKTADVRNAVRAEMQARTASRRTVLLAARKHAVEIAANYSQSFITFMAVLLGWLWTRVFEGVDLEHVEQLHGVEDGTEIVYVPCHRSHLDYMLLSYVIYRKGFAVPHVAAGINLNLPVVGRFVRMGGAFFLRRSFKGDALYAAVFAKYLGVMMARGHSLEYFIEGGRSRTGRLLPPRTGMLLMTVRAFLREPKRPVVFVPVYFGYERIVEGRTYIGELSGQPKEKESLWGALKSTLVVLRSKLGKVHVNFGQPISLAALLERYNPRWREVGATDTSFHAAWIGEAVGDLARNINVGINSAAAVTPINLVAMAILATPRLGLAEIDLARQLELYQRLLLDAPYSPLVTVTKLSGAAMIRYAESMGILQRQKHQLGDIMRMNAESAVLATYYRNNILHLFAMPSLLACCFISNSSMSGRDIKRLVRRVYPYIATELYLRWEEAAVDAVVDSLLESFARLNLLQANAARDEWQRPASTSLEAIRLSVLAQATIQTLERYYLAIALLLQAGSGSITQQALEERCHLMAQRMSVLYGLNSPEFFDKTLFRDFIGLLCRRNVVESAEDGRLSYGEPLLAVATDAQWVLSEQIRHSILQVTLGQ